MRAMIECPVARNSRGSSRFEVVSMSVLLPLVLEDNVWKQVAKDVFTGCMSFLPANHQCQSTGGNTATLLL